jgi:hypothetical protein
MIFMCFGCVFSAMKNKVLGSLQSGVAKAARAAGSIGKRRDGLPSYLLARSYDELGYPVAILNDLRGGTEVDEGYKQLSTIV